MLKRGKSSLITQPVVLCNSPFNKIKLIFYSPFQEAHEFYFLSSNSALHILILRNGNFNTLDEPQGTQPCSLAVTAAKKSNMAHAKFVVLGPPM